MSRSFGGLAPLLPLLMWGLMTACGAAPSFAPLEVEIVPYGGTERDTDTDEEMRRANAEAFQSRRRGRHGDLPPLERNEPENSPDAWPIVKIVNDTPHGLVVWFAGPCARTVSLGPSAEHEVEVCEGTYEIAAELSSEDFVPFVGDGDELEAGYAYSLTFYVVAEPTRRHAR